METVDEEFLAAALDFIDRQHKAGKPFFCYFNSHADARLHAPQAGVARARPASASIPTAWSSTTGMSASC